ncbi:MAG: hypothetical protein AAF657_16825 [Acidobacteriota bacterium]
MRKISRWLDSLLIHALSLAGAEVYGLPERVLPDVTGRPARWRLRLAHP